MRPREPDRTIVRRRSAGPYRSSWIARALLDQAAKQAGTRRLLVESAGYTQVAAPIHRPRGVPYAIIAVCVGGKGLLEVDGATHRIEPGTTFVTLPGIAHSYRTIEEAWRLWWCTLSGTDTTELIENLGVASSAPIVPVRRLDEIIDGLEELVATYEANQTPACLLDASGIAWRLLTRMIADRSRPVRGQPVAQAMAYLADHFDEPVRAAELAAIVGASRSRLMALFKQATGGGVLAYQKQFRMARARRLLDDSDLSIAEVARQAGYSDQYYFSRHFRRLTGMSPRDFRKRGRP